MVTAMMRIAFLLTAFLAALAGGHSAKADDIMDVRFGEHAEYTRIVIETSDPVEFRAFTLSSPAARLVVAFDEADWGADHLPAAAGRGIGAVGQFTFDDRASEPRLVFSLNAPSVVRQTLSLDPNGGGYRTVVDIAPTSEPTFQQTSGFPAPTRTLTDLLMEEAGVGYVPPSCEVIRVVIDPGHGGRDPGAVARFGGGHEKDVNLSAGLILRDLLNATGRYEVVMTRDRDVFVELNDRVRIARQADADLFISLHADSAGDNRSPAGATIYSMNPRAVSRARQNAIREGDWVDPSRPQEVSQILVDMQIANKEGESERFADALRTEIGRAAPLWRDHAMRANFAVLTDAATPAVLFEMGFLTNREDARRLNSERQQRRLMQAALAAIESHFARCGGGEPRSRYIAQAGANTSTSAR
jgi:N-acetylmuramoyl-L-alanine amidase